MISDVDAFIQCQNIVKPVYFHDLLTKVVKYIMEYADKTHTMPTISQIEMETGQKIEKFEEISLQHRQNWFLPTIEEFCRYKALELSVIEGMKLIDKGAYGELERRIKDAMTISLMNDLGTDYFGDPVKRLEQIRDNSKFISTGWNTLDEKLNGGMAPGLYIFCANSGVGKSLLLQNISLNWALGGLNVVYFTLELAEHLAALRIDAMTTGKSTKAVMGNINEAALIVRQHGRQIGGSLILKKFPEAGTSVNTIRAYLKEYEIKMGFKPDAIALDYLDLMYPNNSRVDPSDLWVKDKYVSEELRHLALEFDIPLATASQLNRQSVETSDFDHSHIAGGISKINTADGVFAIFASSAMKENGKIQLQFLKTRNSSSVGQKIDLGYDPICMRISDMDVAQQMSNQQMRENLKQRPTETVDATKNDAVAKLMARFGSKNL